MVQCRSSQLAAEREVDLHPPPHAPCFCWWWYSQIDPNHGVPLAFQREEEKGTTAFECPYLFI